MVLAVKFDVSELGTSPNFSIFHGHLSKTVGPQSEALWQKVMVKVNQIMKVCPRLGEILRVQLFPCMN